MASTNICTLVKNYQLAGGATFRTRWIDLTGSLAAQIEVKLGGTGSITTSIEESNDPVIDFENRATDGPTSANTAATGIDITTDTVRVSYTGSASPLTAPSQRCAHVVYPGRYLRLVIVPTGNPTLTIWVAANG